MSHLSRSRVDSGINQHQPTGRMLVFVGERRLVQTPDEENDEEEDTELS